MSYDDDLNRWMRRLPLAERIGLQRADEMMEAYVPEERAACSCCGGRLSAEGVADPLKRCGSCRKDERRPLARVVQLRSRAPRVLAKLR